MVGVPALITETFSCSYPKHHRARTHKPEVNKHSRVGRGEDGFVERGNPGDRIDGIEGFWGYAKSRLVKYQGIPEEDFYLHLRECEFRFNMRGRDIYRFMLRELRERPLN